MAPKKLPPRRYLCECFDYDPDSGTLTWRVRPQRHFESQPQHGRWNTIYAGKIAGSAGGDGRRRVSIGGEPFSVTRVIWKLVTNKEPPEIDHWNGDPSDNRVPNLRAADRLTNGKNQRRRNGRAAPKGVTKRKTGWEAGIKCNGVTHYLGMFDTAEEAHAAYCVAAKRLHGRFANFGQLIVP